MNIDQKVKRFEGFAADLARQGFEVLSSEIKTVSSDSFGVYRTHAVEVKGRFMDPPTVTAVAYLSERPKSIIRRRASAALSFDGFAPWNTKAGTRRVWKGFRSLDLILRIAAKNDKVDQANAREIEAYKKAGII